MNEFVAVLLAATRPPRPPSPPNTAGSTGTAGSTAAAGRGVVSERVGRETHGPPGDIRSASARAPAASGEAASASRRSHAAVATGAVIAPWSAVAGGVGIIDDVPALRDGDMTGVSARTARAAGTTSGA